MQISQSVRSDRVSKQKETELDEHGYLANLGDLRKSYLATHRMLANKKSELLAEIEKLSDGLPLIELKKQEHRTFYKRLKVDNGNLFAELDLISEMISDTNFIIEWLGSGRRPGSTRGIERLAAYQRERLMDPVKMQSFVSGSTSGRPSNLSEWQRMEIEDALSRLSAQERVCYEMKHGQGYSFKYIADQLGLGASTVENYVVRAQKKISEQVNCQLVLECSG
jgi:RNA polymerase sigma factor (sigma-70 family)